MKHSVIILVLLPLLALSGCQAMVETNQQNSALYQQLGERSGIAERLFRVMNLWLSRLPGGLALATIAMGAIFAAAAGVVGAVEVMIGMMAIPAMQKARYGNTLIAGTICAGGSLGTMIPPSVIAVMYASLAQMSVGKLLAGMMLPGLLMVVLFLAYIFIHGLLYPAKPDEHNPLEEPVELAEKLRLTATVLLPVVLLIVAVLGSILAGIASPTEAAAVGAGEEPSTYAFGSRLRTRMNNIE